MQCIENVYLQVQSASISFESFIYEIYDLGNKTLNHISHAKDVYIVSSGILPENWEVVLASFKYEIKISYLSCLYTFTLTQDSCFSYLLSASNSKFEKDSRRMTILLLLFHFIAIWLLYEL